MASMPDCGSFFIFGKTLAMQTLSHSHIFQAIKLRVDIMKTFSKYLCQTRESFTFTRRIRPQNLRSTGIIFKIIILLLNRQNKKKFHIEMI